MARKFKSKSPQKPAGNGAIPADAKIKVLVKENPRRKGSIAFKRFALFKSGQTVADYVAATKAEGVGKGLGNIKKSLRLKQIALTEAKS